MLERVVVAVLDGQSQQLQGFGARVIELVCSLCHLALERARAVGKLRLSFALGVERRVVVAHDLRFQAAAVIDEQAEQRAEREECDAAVETAEQGQRHVIVARVPGAHQREAGHRAGETAAQPEAQREHTDWHHE